MKPPIKSDTSLGAAKRPRLVRPIVLARPWEHGLPTERTKQRKLLRVHPRGIRVEERGIPKEKTERTCRDDGNLWCGDYVKDGDRLYIAKYHFGGFFTLHRFIFRFGANAKGLAQRVSDSE